MSGENTPSNDETEFIGKENENNLMPSFNVFELLETLTFVELEELFNMTIESFNLFSIPFMQGLG